MTRLILMRIKHCHHNDPKTTSNDVVIDCNRYKATELSKLVENCLLIPANPKAIRHVAKLTIDVVTKAYMWIAYAYRHSLRKG